MTKDDLIERDNEVMTEVAAKVMAWAGDRWLTEAKFAVAGDQLVIVISSQPK